MAELESRIAELEKQLAESQACLGLFEIDAPAGLAIFDRDCRYVHLNQYLARFTDYSIAEHIGKRPSEFLPPQLANHIEANVKTILATGLPQLNDSFTLALTGDSEPLRHWLTSRYPLRNPAGEITGVGIIVVEETSLQQLRKSLNQQEALHLALLETIPARIFMKDCSGAYLYCNDVFAADIGLSQDEILGKTDLDLFRTEMAERYRQADLQVLSSGQTHEFEYQFEKDYREYFIKVRKTPFRDSDGNILGILGIFQDLSEKKLTERQLFISDHALASSLAGIVVSDPAGIITYANSTFLQMWGYSRQEEVVGRTAKEFWTQPPISADTIIAELHRSGAWQGELTGRRIDGTFFDALLTANTVTDDTGQTICMMGSMIEITARKKAEEKLRESEEQLRQIVDNIDDAVWVLDTTKAHLIYISPAFEKIWGRSRDDLFLDPLAWLTGVHPDDLERVLLSIRQRGQEKKTSYRVIRPDGTIRQVFARIFPVSDTSGTIYREVGIVQDITEMKEAEAKILSFSRRLNNVIEEERSAIARDLHDEFGQALVSLRQWQKTLYNATPPALLPQIDHAGFDAIINRFGMIIRNTTHRLRPDILDNLGLAATIGHEVQEFGERFASTTATFELVGKQRQVAGEHALVLYRVLQEALTNVAKHAKAKTLQVKLIYSFPAVILTVDDDGVGFEPAAATRTSIDNGGGGLRGINERMATIGGRVRITSQPGKGTSIRAELNENQGNSRDRPPENPGG